MPTHYGRSGALFLLALFAEEQDRTTPLPEPFDGALADASLRPTHIDVSHLSPWEREALKAAASR